MAFYKSFKKNPELKNITKRAQTLSPNELEIVEEIEGSQKLNHFDLDEITNKEICVKYLVHVIPVTEKILQKNGIYSRILLSFERILRLLQYKGIGELEVADSFRKLKTLCNILHKYFDKVFSHILDSMIYPIFDNTRFIGFVNTLRKQHKMAIFLIDIMIDLSNKNHDQENIEETVKYVSDYIYMARALITREDTILVNLLRKVVGPEDFVNLSYEVKVKIAKTFGKGWRKSVLTDLILVEKGLGIDNLSQYTPILDPEIQGFLDKKHFIND